MKNLIGLTTALNAASQTEKSNGRIQIFPAGRFYAKDGRNPNGWELTKEAATKIIEAANNRKDDYLIDYEHQAIRCAENGQKVIAAGWFKNMEFIEGLGLFATPVEWTETASEHIQKKEYRYISPTFKTNDKGEILELFNVALTNTPAIDGMMNVVALSENPVSLAITKDNFAEEVRKVLNVAGEVSEEALIGAIRSLVREVEYLNYRAVSAKTGSPDPAEYVPLSMFVEMRNKVEKLEYEQMNEKVTNIIETALTEGKITPSQKAWALQYGLKDLVGLTQFLAEAKPIVMLSQTQKVEDEKTELKDLEAMTEKARQMGLTVNEYQERLAKLQ